MDFFQEGPPWLKSKKHRDDFQRLFDICLEKHLKSRAITEWAVKFFQKRPTKIEDIAKALTKKVDDSLFAVNYSPYYSPARFWKEAKLGWSSGFDNYRAKMDDIVREFLKLSKEPWIIHHRIPRAVAVMAMAVEHEVGKCEEHAFMTIYLLTIGHMIQGMPFGQLWSDIFYTALATPKHAQVVLVRGAEFKRAIEHCLDKKWNIKGECLFKHTDKWGRSAWIVDGWHGVAKPFTKESTSYSWLVTQTYRRDPNPYKPPSMWDVTPLQMAYRVARSHGLRIR